MLDVASYNNDRHFGNFFYVLERDEHSRQEQEDFNFGARIVNYFRATRPNKATDVVAIDFESSSSILYPRNEYVYMNDFGSKELTREQIYDKFKHDENFAELIDKDELAETIGSLDPSAVAKDIKQTIGYEIDEDFVDSLERSYDEIVVILWSFFRIT